MGEAVPYSRKTKKRPSVSKRATVVATICAALVAVLVFGGMFLQQQELEQANAQEAAQFNQKIQPSMIATQAPSASPTPPAPTALFMGDSYVRGTGATSESARWTSLVSAEMGWTEDNEAAGGTGYLASSDVNGCGKPFCPNYQGALEERLGDEDADFVIIGGGQNDFRGYYEDSEAVLSAIRDTYTNYRAAFPDAELIAVGPSTVGDPNGAAEVAIDATVQEAATAVGATYVSLLAPDVIEEGMLAADGGHVNDTGHQAIAERVLAALR